VPDTDPTEHIDPHPQGWIAGTEADPYLCGVDSVSPGSEFSRIPRVLLQILE
jgi:hypothetical protein